MTTFTLIEEQTPGVPGRVSVIIPSRDRGAFLDQAISSCALQSWPDVEIVVVDDGSKDSLETVVSRARVRFQMGDRLVYLRQEPQGGATARNLGIVHATGEFVQFLDSDDLLHPDKFSVQISRLIERPELDLMLGLEEVFENIPGDLRVLWNVPRRADCPEDLDRFLLEDAPWSTGSPLWRRRTLERVGGWDPGLVCWQDWQFHVQALCAGLHYEWMHSVLHYIREHRGPRTGQSRSVSKQRSCFNAGMLASHYLETAGLMDDRRRNLVLRYFERHLVSVVGSDEHLAGELGREMTSVMRTLASSRKRRAALAVIWLFNGTYLCRPLVHAYLFAFSYGPPFQPMRNVVHGGMLTSAPEQLRLIVSESNHE